MKANMNDFHTFLSRLGNLHDCIVTQFNWRPDEKTIELEIGDLYFNFAGLPEYAGPTPGRIVLEGVKKLYAELEDLNGQVKIYDFTCEEIGQNIFTALITFSPAGRVSVSYRHAIFPDITLP